MKDHLFLALDLLGSLPPSILSGVGEQVMTGVISILRSHDGLLR